MGNSETLLRTLPFKHLNKWYVEYYLNSQILNSKYAMAKLSSLIKPVKRRIKKNDYDGNLQIVSKIVFKTGDIIFRKENQTGMDLLKAEKGDLLVSSINFHQGAVALNDIGDFVCSTHYQTFLIDNKKIVPEFLIRTLRSAIFLNMVAGLKANGIKNESGFDFIGNFEIPLPSISEQKAILKEYHSTLAKNPVKWSDLKAIVNDRLSYNGDYIKTKNILQTATFSTLVNWSYGHNAQISLSDGSKMVVLSSLLKRSRIPVVIEDDKIYKQITVHTDGKGASLRGSLQGKKIGTKKQFIAHKGQMIVSRIDARNGAFGIVSDELDGAVVTGDFWLFDVQHVSAQYLLLILSSKWFQDRWQAKSSGTTNRQRVNEQDFLDTEIPLLDGKTQKELLDMYSLFVKSKEKEITAQRQAESDFEKAIFL